METYILKKINATVGMFGDFNNFTEVINWLFQKNYPKALDQFGLDGVDDLSEVLTDEKGIFSEDKAMKLCMDNLDGIKAEDDDPKTEWGDTMYDRVVGK